MRSAARRLLPLLLRLRPLRLHPLQRPRTLDFFCPSPGACSSASACAKNAR